MGYFHRPTRRQPPRRTGVGGEVICGLIPMENYLWGDTWVERFRMSTIEMSCVYPLLLVSFEYQEPKVRLTKELERRPRAPPGLAM